MVMFILALVATVFIALVGRNLTRSERMSNTDAVASIAEAGVRYADEMLTTSEDGADWRPAPDNVPVANEKIDPDYDWVREYSPAEAADHSTGPTGGYTRFNSGQGRFLLRVSYVPNPNVPLSKYIKIESIGRWGNVLGDVAGMGDPTRYDPTTLIKDRLRREITAYKPIGITDVCRFVTNKDNRSVDVALGVPGFRTEFGRYEGTGGNSKYGTRGGPVRVNASLIWYGNYGNNASVDIYLRGIAAKDDTGASSDLLPIEGVEVAGDIKVDADPGNDNSRVKVQVHALIKGGSGSYTKNDFDVVPSTDDDTTPGTLLFTTAGGFYRDGRDTPDKDRRPRGVKRIEPPLVDQPDATGTTSRYKVLTLNSGMRVKPQGRRTLNNGALGWGRGVYINNPNDKQDESETLFGGVTNRADWTQPGNIMTSNWKGPYYVPPAAVITLLPNDFEGLGDDKQYFFTITRTDTVSGRRAVWYDAGGNPRPDWGATVRMPYPDAERGRTLKYNDSSVGGAQATMKIGGNGVIYAEGNIRIRGMLPPGMRLTVVSNHNIYIDGNVLKYRDPAMEIGASDHYRGADPTCGLALLARQNVVVNTTQFFAPLSSIGSDDYGTDSLTGGNASHVVLRNSPDSALRMTFDFGPYESETGAEPTDWCMFIRQAGEHNSPAYINAWMNPSAASTLTDWGILLLNNNASDNPVYPGLPKHVWGVGDPRYGASTPPGAGVGSVFLCDVFSMTQCHAQLFTGIGMPNILQIALDSNVYTRSNYWMGGLAVLPMDVRIEAICYAQEGSFFVIPGYWLNPNPGDNRQAFIDSGVRPPGVDQRFPFYGEPADIRVIIDGAVSENLPASIADVEAWMARWGRIPDQYGSSSIATAHPREGITFLYDDHVGWPLDDSADPKPVRVDSYERALPLTPRLPVSGSLIYFGDVM